MDMCIHVHMDGCIDTFIDMCVDGYIDMCIVVCVNTCIDACIDMCVDNVHCVQIGDRLATKGLRILSFAYRLMDEDQWEELKEKYDLAETEEDQER